MFTKKDRKIANLEVKVKNRDKVIEHCGSKIKEQEDFICQIVDLATGNDYDRPDVILAKIKDLVRDYQSKN